MLTINNKIGFMNFRSYSNVRRALDCPPPTSFHDPLQPSLILVTESKYIIEKKVAAHADFSGRVHLRFFFRQHL